MKSFIDYLKTDKSVGMTEIERKSLYDGHLHIDSNGGYMGPPIKHIRDDGSGVTHLHNEDVGGLSGPALFEGGSHKHLGSNGEFSGFEIFPNREEGSNENI